MKRVLFTSYDGLTDNLGQSQVIPYLTGLSQMGYKIDVISCEKKDTFEKNRSKIEQLLATAGIGWHFVFYTKTPPVLSTVFDLLRMYWIGAKLFRKHPYQLIHSRTLISAVIGVRLKNRFNTKFIFDMRGFWADERAESGLWPLSNPVFRILYHFFKHEELKMLRQADYTICLTNKARAYIQSDTKYAAQFIPIEVIPCCADLELFNRKSVDEHKLKELKKTLSIKADDFVLSYLGSIGTWYMLDEMLDFFKLLQLRLPNSKFLFISNDKASDIKSRATEKGIDVSSVLIAPAERHWVPTYLALSHWSVFFILPVFSKSGSSPTKQGEIMGMGIPHICNAGVGDVDEIVTASNAGVLLRNFNDADYRNAVSQMLNDSNRVNQQEIVQSANRYYSLDMGIKKYKAVYDKVLQG